MEKKENRWKGKSKSTKTERFKQPEESERQEREDIKKIIKKVNLWIFYKEI